MLLGCDKCPIKTETTEENFTLALLVQEDAGKLSLIEDIQKGLLRLASHLSQSQSFCYRCHETALDHVHNQHHLGGIAYFTWE